MKGHKFKLEAVLKIRKMKEEQCKASIGRVQMKINRYKSDIKGHQDHIKESFESQEISLQQGITVQDAQFYPFFVKGKMAHIKQIETEVSLLDEDIRQLYIELNKLRAEYKVVEKMKEKDYQQYKKKLNKKQFEDIEEQVQNWKQSQGIIGY